MRQKNYATPTNEDLGQTSNWLKLVATYLPVARLTILDRLVLEHTRADLELANYAKKLIVHDICTGLQSPLNTIQNCEQLLRLTRVI